MENIQTATNGASLVQREWAADANDMNLWVSNIIQSHGEKLKSNLYQSVFRCMDIEDNDMLIGAVGRLLGMKITVSRKKIVGEIDMLGEIVFTKTIDATDSFTSVPYDIVFKMCNELQSSLKGYIDEKYHIVPLLGGIKSVILSEDAQTMIDYYLPEIEMFGDCKQFSIFNAGHIPSDILAQTVERATAANVEKCVISSKVQCPDKEEYLGMMENVLDELKKDNLQKIVISRKCTVTPKNGFSELDYASYLFNGYFQEYFYSFSQGNTARWIGISPEIIIKQSGDKAVTKPLAATRKKSADPAENERLAEEMRTSKKDIVEHEHALNFMVAQLENGNIGDVKIGATMKVFETPYTLHLKSEIDVTLNATATYFDIIKSIYPPATVWGIPVDKTEHLLKKSEPFDRSQFTGIYGYWNFKGEADTALVIRTACVDGNEISAYAGGGIVKYSDPNAEFNETVNKMSPLLSYFVE